MKKINIKKTTITINNLSKAISALCLAGLKSSEAMKSLSEAIDLAYFKYWTTENQWKVFGWHLDKKLNELWFIK